MMPALTSERFNEPLETILAAGSLVYVTCRGPYWGVKGVICTVDAIDASLYFYLVNLLEGQMKEPIWLVHDDIAAVEGESANEKLSRPSNEHSLLRYDRGQTSVEHMPDACKKPDEKPQKTLDYRETELSRWVRTKTTEPLEAPVKIHKQQRERYQEQIEVDKELIQKQQKILQAHLEHAQNPKSLIELNKQYIENQKRLIQRNRERIEMLKHTTGVLVGRQREARATHGIKKKEHEATSDWRATTLPADQPCVAIGAVQTLLLSAAID